VVITRSEKSSTMAYFDGNKGNDREAEKKTASSLRKPKNMGFASFTGNIPGTHFILLLPKIEKFLKKFSF